MSNYLKIYDFTIRHKSKNNNVTYFELAENSDNLRNHIKSKTTSLDVAHQIVLAAFETQLLSDLNSELISDLNAKRIVKKARKNEDQNQEINLKVDSVNNNIYGILYGGKVAENSSIEKVTTNTDGSKQSFFENANGRRIYDNFFFLLHISFKCNRARLFILTRRNTTNIDNIMKSYLKNNLFKADKFLKTQVADYMDPDLQKRRLEQLELMGITVSKGHLILDKEEGTDYKVVVKLIPKNRNLYQRITKPILDSLMNSKLTLGESTVEDATGTVKFSTYDPEGNKRKVFAYGTDHRYIPSLELKDEQVFDDKNNIDVEKLEKICRGYIKYENDQLK